jgi:hypothetical protein
MATAQERWGQKGFAPSQRRIGQMLMAIKARAWTRGDGHATTDDMIVTQHMAWNHPDHAKDAREVVMEFANVFARKAQRMREALEPVLAELDEVRKEINESAASPPTSTWRRPSRSCATSARCAARRTSRSTQGSAGPGRARPGGRPGESTTRTTGSSETLTEEDLHERS